MQDIRTITLDLDDTLWAIAPVIARAESALRDWFREYHPRIPEMFTRKQAIELRARVFASNHERAHDLTFMRYEVMRQMGEAAGYTDMDLDAAFAVFDEQRNTLDLFPDVRPALSRLNERFTLVAVTNGNADLDRIGIGDLFDGVVSARMAGSAKPERRIFDAAVDAGGAAAVQTLHVGDSPELDVDGARLAGLRTVWINRVGHEWPDHIPEPDGVVTDLHQLDVLLNGGKA